MIIYIAAIGIALIGLVLHWLKRWLRVQTSDTLLQHLMDNPNHTIVSLISLVGAVSGVVSMGSIDLMDAQTIGTLIMTGYTIDSLVNKGSDY